MTFFKNPNIKRELIMKHYSTPKLKQKILNPKINHYSIQCVDEIHIDYDLNNEILDNIKWDGKGCAIFQSSSDIFLLKCQNKTKNECINLAIEYEKMINQEEVYDENILEELIIFENVKKQLNRLNCANMVSQAILKNIK